MKDFTIYLNGSATSVIIVFTNPTFQSKTKTVKCESINVYSTVSKATLKGLVKLKVLEANAQFQQIKNVNIKTLERGMVYSLYKDTIRPDFSVYERKTLDVSIPQYTDLEMLRFIYKNAEINKIQIETTKRLDRRALDILLENTPLSKAERKILYDGFT